MSNWLDEVGGQRFGPEEVDKITKVIIALVEIDRDNTLPALRENLDNAIHNITAVQTKINEHYDAPTNLQQGVHET